MKIGIDLDGVVIDSETTFRTYEEIYDLLHLQGNREDAFQFFLVFNCLSLWNLVNRISYQ